MDRSPDGLRYMCPRLSLPSAACPLTGRDINPEKVAGMAVGASIDPFVMPGDENL
jgi:hypothetical protein